MSNPVPDVRNPSTLPLWLMAIAIGAIAIRSWFFPPCCDTATAMPIMKVLCDSIRPIPDGDNSCSFGLGDTVVMLSANVMVVRGFHPDTITIQPGRGVQIYRQP